MQVINPTFEYTKELKYLDLTIRHYVDSVSVLLNEKAKPGQFGTMVFSKSYDTYDESAISEIKEFIKIYNDEKEGKEISGSTKLYFELIKENW